MQCRLALPDIASIPVLRLIEINDSDPERYGLCPRCCRIVSYDISLSIHCRAGFTQPRSYLDGRFSDITITCGEETFKCHKMILCRRSTFFDRACSGDFIVSQLQPVNCIIIADLLLIRPGSQIFHSRPS